jgi:hypothetical protein
MPIADCKGEVVNQNLRGIVKMGRSDSPKCSFQLCAVWFSRWQVHLVSKIVARMGGGVSAGREGVLGRRVISWKKEKERRQMAD